MMTDEKGRLTSRMGTGQLSAASMIAAEAIHAKALLRQHWDLECYRGGELLWRDGFTNLVVNEGLTDILEQYYNGAAYTAAHFVGLTDGTPTFAAGDTMSSHAGWVEVVEYQAQIGSPSAGVRAPYTPAAAASQSINNSAAKAIFDIVAGMTVGGAFLSTDGTKGGTSGTLVGGNAFTGGDRTLAAGDTLNVTVTASMTST